MNITEALYFRSRNCKDGKERCKLNVQLQRIQCYFKLVTLIKDLLEDSFTLSHAG